MSRTSINFVIATNQHDEYDALVNAGNDYFADGIPLELYSKILEAVVYTVKEWNDKHNTSDKNKKGKYKNSSGIVRAKDCHPPKRNYLFEGAKVGDKYRCRDGSIVTLTTKLRNGRYGSCHYFTPDAGGEEYGVMWDGLCVWADAKNGEPITTMKDVVEKI